MQKILFAIALIISIKSFSQLVVPRFNFTPTNPTTEYYVTNSDKVVMDFQDSMWLRIMPDSLRFPLLSSSVNHGAPNGLLWTASDGLVRRSPVSSISLTSGQVTTALGFAPYNSSNPSNYITQSGARSAISLTTTGTSGAATYNSSTGVLNVPTYATFSFAPSSNVLASGARNFNQAYQVSTTNYVDIRVSAQVSASLSLSGGQGGVIYLEKSANGSTGWQTINNIAGSNTGALTIGLSTVQVTGGQVSTILPPGWYWRLRTSNTTGTPTYTFTGGEEITY